MAVLGQLYTVLLALFIVACKVTEQCDVGWTAYDGMCYRASTYSDGTHSWHSARSWCNNNGGDLTSITSEAEDNFTLSLAVASDYNGNFWLGLNQLSDRRTFLWTDGSTYEYSDWIPPHPYNDEKHLCANMRAYDTTWQTDNCGRKAGFICKKSPTSTDPVIPVPTPVVPGYCPSGYVDTKHGNKCLKVVRSLEGQALNWTQALDYCRAQPGVLPDLASISSEEEQNIVLAHLRDVEAGLWIGMHLTTYDWLWVDNSHVGYSHWLPGEPSYGSEECVEFETWEVGMWNNVYCSSLRGYVCQTFKDNDAPISTPPTPPFACPEGYVAYWYACYRFVKTWVTWAEADQLCRRDGAHLVSIHSEPENAAVFVYAKSQLPAWLGLKRNVDGEYVWTDGWPDIYTKWSTAEPSYDNCVVMTTLGTWDAVHCYDTYTYSYVCKISNEDPPTTPPLMEGVCPKGWTAWGSDCYAFPANSTDYVTTWHSAQTRCIHRAAEYSTTLASIHSLAENQFIYDSFMARGLTKDVWIGLTQTNVSDPFYWVDNSVLQFTRWAVGEPSGHPVSIQCVHMYVNLWPGHWNDHSCADTSTRYYVCKTPKVPTPTTPPPVAGICPEGPWHKYGKSCFLFRPDDHVDWYTAQARCAQNANSTLASLHEFEENYFVSELMYDITVYPTSVGCFIGLYKQGGGYEWLDGTPLNYTNWNWGQPDNLETEHCVEVSHAGGRWNNIVCSSKRGYVCKVAVEGTEPPAAEEGLSGGAVAGIVIGVLAAVALLSFVMWRYRDNVQHHVGQVRQRLDQLPRPWNTSSDSKSNKSSTYKNYDDQSLGGASVTSEQQPTYDALQWQNSVRRVKDDKPTYGTQQSNSSSTSNRPAADDFDDNSSGIYVNDGPNFDHIFAKPIPRMNSTNSSSSFQY